MHQLTFFHLHSNVHIFGPILLKVAQFVCIIVRINPIENEEISSVSIGKGAMSNFGLIFSHLHD